MYDLAVIGAGAGGVAAAKAACRAGLKVAIIEKSKSEIGGTCLNRGCIPTKFFINQAKITQDFSSINRQSNSVIDKIRIGLLSFLEAQKATVLFGQASFVDKNKIKINNETIEAQNIIIATGSLPAKVIQHPKAIFAQDLFSRKDLPKKCLVIGAGYIGVEFACLLARLGRDVILVEKEPNILPSFDQAITARLRIILDKKGVKIHPGADLKQYNLDDFDIVISCAGRLPNTQGLGLEKAGVKLDDKGWVISDEFMRTNVENIYCCGDINGKKLLAYTAEYQAQLCVDNILGKPRKEDYYGVPDCVFSTPALARVGISQDEARNKNIKFRQLRTNFLKFSSSYVYDDTEGFIEILADEKDKILGATIISNQAAELISIISLCMRSSLTVASLKDNLFIHPTSSEIIPNFLKEI